LGPPLLGWSRHYIRMLKLLRAFRLRDYGRGAQVISTRLLWQVVRICKLLFQFLLLTHMIGSLGYKTAVSADENAYNPWVFRPADTEEDTEDVPLLGLYLRAFFYALTLTTGIGNTPYPPLQNSQEVVVGMAMIVGSAFWAFVIGSMIDLIASVNKANNEYERKLDELMEWMEYRKLPSNLTEILVRHFNYQWNRSRFINEEDVLSQLSPAMQLILRRFLCRHIVERVPIFANTPSTFVDEIVNRLKAKFVTSGEIICNQGETGSEMFIIATGRVEVLRVDSYEAWGVGRPEADRGRKVSLDSSLGQRALQGSVRLAILEAGTFFGEIAMVFEMPRISTCRALTQCDLFSLKKEDFDSVMMSHPDQLERVKEIAAARKDMTKGLVVTNEKANTPNSSATARMICPMTTPTPPSWKRPAPSLKKLDSLTRFELALNNAAVDEKRSSLIMRKIALVRQKLVG